MLNNQAMIKHLAKAKKIDSHLLAFALRFLSFWSSFSYLLQMGGVRLCRWLRIKKCVLDKKDGRYSGDFAYFCRGITTGKKRK